MRNPLMKFQDSSFKGLKVTVGTKSVTHPRTHPPTHARSKSNMPHQLFQSWGHKKCVWGGGAIFEPKTLSMNLKKKKEKKSKKN